MWIQICKYIHICATLQTTGCIWLHTCVREKIKWWHPKSKIKICLDKQKHRSCLIMFVDSSCLHILIWLLDWYRWYLHLLKWATPKTSCPIKKHGKNKNLWVYLVWSMAPSPRLFQKVLFVWKWTWFGQCSICRLWIRLDGFFLSLDFIDSLWIWLSVSVFFIFTVLVMQSVNTQTHTEARREMCLQFALVSLNNMLLIFHHVSILKKAVALVRCYLPRIYLNSIFKWLWIYVIFFPAVP